ncbi:hypothetical protein [Prevotella brunnea]|uniref:hypothetical protein n=1 Tax=Prevotella brunnea TaxID=2508867 RepID=UPI001315431A|nr:hypothetical protein [Prevotella brunnea]
MWKIPTNEQGADMEFAGLFSTRRAEKVYKPTCQMMPQEKLLTGNLPWQKREHRFVTFG